MIIYILYGTLYIVFDKIKKKIMYRSIHTGVKMICWRNNYNISAYEKLLDWVLL